MEDIVQALLQNMTIQEKAGQVTQLPTRYFKIRGSQLTGTETKLGISEDQKWLAGSILGKLDAESMRNIQHENLRRSRLKIPMMFMTDVIHGYQTVFPVPLAMACSFNPAVAEECARVSAKEASASGYQVTFSPMVDVVRDPRWGRVMESFGEEAKINADMGSAMVRGYQGADLFDRETLAACAKHFTAYGKVEGGRDYNSSDLSEFVLQNQYLPSFRACVDAGVKLVMAAFQVVNGVPATANQWLLQDILRKQLRFDGIIISDWSAVTELIHHRVASNEYDCGKLALEAGIQIEMATASIMKNIEAYIELDQNLEILLDQAVEKVLCLKVELGLFEDPYRGVSAERERRELCSYEKKEAARNAALEAAVLLKNNGILPMEKKKEVVLAGPYAITRDILGPWSIDGNTEHVVSIAEGLKSRYADVKYVFPTEFECISEKERKQIVQGAKETGVVILALGEPESWSGEAGSRADITLPAAQCDLAKELHKENISVVVLLFNGRPLDIRELEPYADAILEMWFPGTEGGNAAAQLLYGEENPSGRLAMSFPYGSGQIPVSYNAAPTGRPKELLVNEKRYKSQYLDIPNEPFYSFGYGLSYTKFKTELGGEVRKNLDGSYVIPMKITNLGNRDGKEVVQLYIHKKKSMVARPDKELAAYRKVSVRAGESVTTEMVLGKELWKYWVPNKCSDK